MKRIALLFAVGIVCGAPASASDRGAPVADVRAALPVPAPTSLGEIEARLLDAHNRERAAVGHAPLQWDPYLAQSAAAYGPTLARLGRLVHAAKNDRPGQSENLAMAWAGTMSPEQLVAMWADEKRHMQPGLFPYVSRTGYWKDVGHYTQMVWRTTTHVGCAIHRAEWDFLVCRYSPPGNRDGQPVFAPAPSGPTIASRR